MQQHPVLQALRAADLVARRGYVRRVLPLAIEATGPAVALGAHCEIMAAGGEGGAPVLAEVIGIQERSVTLAPLDAGPGIALGAEVVALTSHDRAPVGDALLGRAVDPLGRPIDGQGRVEAGAWRSLSPRPVSPLSRQGLRTPLQTGLRAIDGLLTLAEGQRVGIFAASGVGKTSLVTQLCRGIDADRIVICLVGERGREVEALWRSELPDALRAKTVLVAATSDQPAALRARAGAYALSLAEHFGDQGHHVLVVVDSVTRLAMALREVGLAAGEPPTLRAYPPRAFAALPNLVERCGVFSGGGRITGLFTVLAESDDLDDPVCELMKSILDGHIILSRELAEQGHFPAIDAPRSISRLADSLRSSEHRRLVRTAIKHLATYEKSRNLVESGLYAAGSNPDIDQAIRVHPSLLAFLRQGEQESATAAETLRALASCVAEGG